MYLIACPVISSLKLTNATEEDKTDGCGDGCGVEQWGWAGKNENDDG